MKQLNHTLNPYHEIYNQLAKTGLWKDVLADQDLYVEVCKDNGVNTYYKGLSLLHLSFWEDLLYSFRYCIGAPVLTSLPTTPALRSTSPRFGEDLCRVFF